MTRRPRIAGAPISWGVCEAPDWGEQLPPEVVLDELAQAGFAATEAGPDGWLPGGGAQLHGALDPRGLELAGAFLPVSLVDDSARARSLPAFERVLDRVASFPGAAINLAVLGAGDDYDGRVELDEDAWRSTLAGLDELAARAAERGVPCALHPHAGTAVERGDDLERVLDGSSVGLCLDTGHLLLGGVDPVEVAREVGDRIVHVHLKDVDSTLAERWRDGGFASMREAVDAGVWRALGTGDAHVGEVLELLARRGYDGWYVLERDASLSPEQASDATARIADAVRERTWVEEHVG